jgi:hypothetical protein
MSSVQTYDQFQIARQLLDEVAPGYCLTSCHQILDINSVFGQTSRQSEKMKHPNVENFIKLNKIQEH